jgi:hypothetical protein
MWNWFNCYLSGRHDYGMWCEPGAIFLRCVHCGRRSPGWSVQTTKPQPMAAIRPVAALPKTKARRGRQALPFGRAAALR